MIKNYNLSTISSYFFKMFSLNMSFYTLHNDLKALAQGGNINAFFTISQSFTMILMLLEILKTIQLLPLIPFMAYAPLALVIMHSLTHDEHFYFLPLIYYFCGPPGYMLLQLACYFMPHILERSSALHNSTWLNDSYLILLRIHTFLHNIQKIITKKIDVFFKNYCNLSHGNDDFHMLIINVLYYSYYCAVIPYIFTVTYYQPFSLMFRLFLMSIDIYPLYYFYILHNHRHYISASLQMTLEYIAKIFNIMNVLPKTLSSITLMLSPFYIWHEYTDANIKAAKDELSYAQWTYIAHKNNSFFFYVLYLIAYSVSTIIMLIYSGSSRLREKTQDIVFINYITYALDYAVQALFFIPQCITHALHYLLKTFMYAIDYIRGNSNTYLPSALSGIIATVCDCIRMPCEMLISIIDTILTLEDILSGWVTYFDAFITYYNSLTTTQHFYTIQPSSQQETTQHLPFDTIFTDLSEDMLQFDVQKASFFSPSIQNEEKDITDIPQAHIKLEHKHIDFIASTFNNLLPILKNNRGDKEKFCESMWNSTGVIEDTNTHHGMDFILQIKNIESLIVLSEDAKKQLITITTGLEVKHYSLLLDCILQRISTDDLHAFHRESPSSTAHYCDALSENFSHIIPGRCKIASLQDLLNEIAPLQDLLNITQIIQHITDSMALLTSPEVLALEGKTRVEVKTNINAYCTMVLKTTCRYYARIISLKNFDTILLPVKAFYIEDILDTAAGLRRSGEESLSGLVDTFWLMQRHDIAALLDIEKCYADLGDNQRSIKDNLEEYLTTHDIMLSDAMIRDAQPYAGLIFYLSQKYDSFMSLLASHIKDYGPALIGTFIVHCLITHKEEKYLKIPNIRYLLSDYQNTLMRMHGGCAAAFVTSLGESIQRTQTQDTVATTIEQAAFIYRKNVIHDLVHKTNSQEHPALRLITNLLDGMTGVHSDAQIQKIFHIHIGPISKAAFLDAVTEPNINTMLQYQLYTTIPLCDPYQLLCAVIADFSQYDIKMFLPPYHQIASNILPQYIFGELFLDDYVTQHNAFNYPLVHNVPQLDYFIRMMKEMMIISDPSIEDNDTLTDTINRYILDMTPQNFVGFIIALLLHKGLIAPKKEIMPTYTIKHRDQQSILKDTPLMQHKMSSIIHDALYIFYGPLRDAALYAVNAAYPNFAKDVSPVSSMYFKKGTEEASKDTNIKGNSSWIKQALDF